MFISDNWVKFPTVRNALQSTSSWLDFRKSRFPPLFICLQEFWLVEQSLFIYLNLCLFLYDSRIILWKLLICLYPSLFFVRFLHYFCESCPIFNIMFMALQGIICLKIFVLKRKHIEFHYVEHLKIYLNASAGFAVSLC